MRRDGQCPRVPAGVELHYLSQVVLVARSAFEGTRGAGQSPRVTHARARRLTDRRSTLSHRAHTVRFVRCRRRPSRPPRRSRPRRRPPAARGPPASAASSPRGGVARRTAVATALTRSRFLGGDASPAAFVSSATGSRARSRVVGARRVQTRALASPNELGDVAGTLGLTLSGFEQVMGKASFGALLGASSVYCYKVRVTTHPGS